MNSCINYNNNIQEKFQDNHSIIVDYPINYNIYPLANDINIIKIVLEKDEFVIMPPRWFHWVYTEPETIAISYEVIDCKIKDKNNIFYQTLLKNIPSKYRNKRTNISYNNFINNSLNETYRVMISETSDCSPVIKNSTKKQFIKDILLNVINNINIKKNYAYIGSQRIPKNNILNNYDNIKNLINFDDNIMFKYNSTLWFTLDKIINSGLHFDTSSKILYVLTGKKTVYLIHPKEQKNLYVKIMKAL
jgi:hypothetical protein